MKGFRFLLVILHHHIDFQQKKEYRRKNLVPKMKDFER